MAYSKSISTLRGMQPYLKLLTEFTPCEWQRTAPDADKWAYKLREALFIARREAVLRKDDEEIQALANAALMFTIQVINPHLVRAVLADVSEIQAEPTPTRQALDAGPDHRVSKIQSVQDLKDVWLRAQPTNDKLHFPDARLSDDELSEAAGWAASLTPPWMLLRPKGTNSLTLAPDDPRVPAEAKVRPVKRAISPDAPPPKLADSSAHGRKFGKVQGLPPLAAEEVKRLDAEWDKP